MQIYGPPRVSEKKKYQVVVAAAPEVTWAARVKVQLMLVHFVFVCPCAVCEGEYNVLGTTIQISTTLSPISHSSPVSLSLMTDTTAMPFIVMLTGNHGKRPSFGIARDLLRCRAFSASNKSPAELRTLLAKFANLGKGQGIPRPVGIGRGMEVGMGRETDDHRMWSATRAGQRLLFPPPCLPFPAPFLDC